MVELRLDYAEELDVAGVLADRRVPVIVTCRPAWCGGHFAGSEEERRAVLRHALELGAEYVDVEWTRVSDINRAVGHADFDRLVLSFHDFDGIPADLESRYRTMCSTGAAVVKVAVRVTRLTDLVRLRDLGGQHQTSTGHVVIGMGPAGIPSRLLPDRFGSRWTYAGDAVAPGQLGLADMQDQYRVGEVGAGTELFGIVGAPLAHSLSPAMHNAGFAEIGRDAVYLPLEASDLDDLQTFADAFDLRGVSVTAPFKETAMDLVTTTDDLSRRVGATNTLKHSERGWEGKNTDIPGFLSPLEGRVPLDGARVSVLGAGGAARGVVVALADGGAVVTVHARQLDRARDVASLVGGRAGVLPPALGSWDLLVNTTPVGTSPHVDDTPLPTAEFSEGTVYDLVYNPAVTRLMRDAAAAGCTTIGGLDMLVGQAERQFEWWMGVSPPDGVFGRAAVRALERHHQREEQGQGRMES